MIFNNFFLRLWGKWTNFVVCPTNFKYKLHSEVILVVGTLIYEFERTQFSPYNPQSLEQWSANLLVKRAANHGLQATRGWRATVCLPLA